MTVLQALPAHGDVFFDARDDGRSLRVGWHPDEGLVVLSTWRHGSCIASCHVERADVPALIGQLVEGLAVPPSQPWTAPIYVDFSRGRRRSAARLAAWLRTRVSRRPS